MGRYVRANSLLLKSVVKIAVYSNPNPYQRAQLLNYGFDEVLDSSKAELDLAKARITAVAKRYENSRISLSVLQKTRTSVAHICNPSDLTPRQLSLLLALLRHEGSGVSISQLGRMIQPEDYGKFRRAIKVAISNLRRKISTEYKIKSDKLGGYRLIKADHEG